MRVTNDPKSSTGDPFGELLRIQSEFTARLAEETMRFFRRLQGALGPLAPGTVVGPDPERTLSERAEPGSRVRLALEIENRQRVHCLVTPMLAPLVEAGGATWFPSAEASPSTVLLAPDETNGVNIELTVPADLPAGIYRGALLLPGFRSGGIPVTLRIVEATADKQTATKPSTPKRAKGSPRPSSRARRGGVQ